MAEYKLSGATDRLDGTDDSDVFILAGSIANLSGLDVLSGKGGSDTLQFLGTRIGLSADRLAGLSSVETLDFSAATDGLAVGLDAASVSQAGAAGLRLNYAGNAMTLDVSAVNGAGPVVLGGTGAVTLRNFEGQAVTIADGVSGTVLGGTGADTVRGGTGNDTARGGLGDDVLSGNGGGDTLDGGDGNDRLSGGAGDDVLLGGAGHDWLDLGNGRDTATGGAGSDTFRIAPESVATITDFDAADPMERIDLRAFAGIRSFTDLKLAAVAGGTLVTGAGLSLTLSGVAAASLGAGNFVFPGQLMTPMADALTAVPVARLTLGADNLVGTAGDDVFQASPNMESLTGRDVIKGGAGTDTLRYPGAEASLDASRLAGLSSVERIDLSQAVRGISVSLDAASVRQADNKTLTLLTGNNATLLDVSDVGNAGTVVVAGTGLVTLRNVEGQAVSIADEYNGRVTGGTGSDVVRGGSGNDTIFGLAHDDTLSGGAGNDRLDGGTENDRLFGGAGDDVLIGGEGNDRLDLGTGNDVATGGTGADWFKVGPGSTATITDLSVPLERIDLRAIGSATDFSKLAITDTTAGAKVSVAGTTILLNGVKAAQLEAQNFIFAGQSDPTTIHVKAGTALSVIQQLVDEADPGTTIKLDAGTYVFDKTLTITRSDITLEGAGSGKTLIRSTITDKNASPTISVEFDKGPQKRADFAKDAVKGSSTIELTSTKDFKVGDVIYLGQPNDQAYLDAGGNIGLYLPPDYYTSPVNYYLRESLLKITAIDGNKVTLSHPVPFTFQAGKAWAGETFQLKNVHVGGFRIESALAKANPTQFELTNPAWDGQSTVQFKSVADSSISDVKLFNNGAGGFTFTRVYGIEGDHLFTQGALNKDGGNGYGYNLREAFALKLTHLVGIDMRHTVLTSSWHAEHYNYIQVDYTNRDINFHGGPDSFNTVIVDKAITYGGTSWRAVGPGALPIHPNATIEDNDVTFKYLRSGYSDLRPDAPGEILHASNSGGDIESSPCRDTLYGGNSADILNGMANDDLIYGGGGNDRLIGGQGRDRLFGGVGDDRLEGGADSDILDGEAGRDLLLGGDGADLLRLGAGDTGTGGAGSDTFAVSGSATITDFSTANPLERLDLRAIKAATGLKALKITQSGANAVVTVGGVTITLLNVNAKALDEEQFVFYGEKEVTLAERQVVLPTASLSSDVDTLKGTNGNDIFETSLVQLSGKDQIDGGKGVDTLRVSSGKLEIDDGKFAGLRSIEVLDVSQAASPVGLQIGAGTVGQADGDRLTLFGGNNDMVLNLATVGKAGTVVAETFGTVTLRNFENQAVTVADTVHGRVVGGSGGDVIRGGARSDVLDGGLGRDQIYGGGGNDRLIGGQGSDRLFGGAGDDRLEGGTESDLLDGEAGRDLLFGGDGADLLRLGAGDTGTGGAGSDTFAVSGTTTIADFSTADPMERIDLRAIKAATGLKALKIAQSGANAVVSVGGVTITLLNVKAKALDADQFVFFGDKAMTLAERQVAVATASLSANADTLKGTSGNDIFETSVLQLSGKDQIDGGKGVDTLRVSSGKLQIDDAKLAGLKSIEILDVSQAASPVGLQIGAAAVGQADGDRLTLLGGNNDMVLNLSAVGKAGTVVVETFGTVTLRNLDKQAVTVSDNVKGHVVGGSGADVIRGGARADILDGGTNGDILTGNGGADTFVFSTALNKRAFDHITDFNPVQDQIELHKAIFGALAPGALKVEAFKDLGVAGAKLDADDRMLYNSKTGELYYDADGSGKGAAIKVAELDNHAKISHLDFFVV